MLIDGCQPQMMLQLNPPLPFYTPKGPALAHFAIDYGAEHHILWVCFLNDGGSCWTFSNPDIRMETNFTMGRTKNVNNDSTGIAVSAVSQRNLETGNGRSGLQVGQIQGMAGRSRVDGQAADERDRNC